MRILTIFMVLGLLSPLAGQDKVVKLKQTIIPFPVVNPKPPDTLFNWLNIIDLKDYRLLSAIDQNGYFFAVKLDADRDIVFCHFENSDSTARPNDGGSYRVSIEDLDGKNQIDHGERKQFPPSFEVTFTGESKVGPLKISQAISVIYLTGRAYRLKNRNIDRVRVRFLEELPGKAEVALFDQIVEVPRQQAKSP